MAHIVKSRKMLISIVGRHHGEQLVAVSKAAGARGGTIAMGRTVGGGRIMQALSLADVDQDIVFTLMGDEAEAVLEAVKSASRESPKKLTGIALLLDAYGMILNVDQTQVQEHNSQMINSGRNIMESGYKLITVIINHGYADDVMAVARKAGARGGTILNARGTGTEEDVKFFGISLVPEKEMLLIVAENGKIDAIVEAVGATPNLCEPGGGIIFNMNVEQFIVLGK